MDILIILLPVYGDGDFDVHDVTITILRKGFDSIYAVKLNITGVLQDQVDPILLKFVKIILVWQDFCVPQILQN